MASICIIPARGGSKRIPRKNIKPFCGRPIIEYSIEAAFKSGLFDVVMVSTDDDEIAAIAKEAGAAVPFVRSAKNADDFTGTGDVVIEVLNEYEKLGMEFNVACCIYATAAFINFEKIREGYNILLSGGFDAVFPVVKYGSPIWRSYNLSDNMGVIMNFPENDTKRSQDLPNAYYDAGQFYIVKTRDFSIIPNKNSFGLNKGAIVLDEMEVQDIDTVEDWKIAELKFKLIKENK